MHVSIVIPALNEASRIETTLQTLRRQEGRFELIVVDGGSQDDTAACAERHARVVTSDRGRARQMNAGARVARGDALLFLHADTTLPSNGISRIADTLANPAIDAGAFRLRFDRRAPLLDFYSFCTRLNTPLLCFGDRTLFVRRAVFEAIDGFQEIPAFEDLEIVRRLHRRGRFAFLPDYVTTAARRFDEHGHLRQQLLNSYLWTRYLLGTPPEKLAALYRYSAKPKAPAG
ncbi:MAG: TIGR04283 family arsenosugar biosynthesis glycosyltransferase [Rhodothermales bacterium]